MATADHEDTSEPTADVEPEVVVEAVVVADGTPTDDEIKDELLRDRVRFALAKYATR